MFEEAAKRSGYFVYTRKFDQVVPIDKVVDAEVVERMGTYFAMRGLTDDKTDVDEMKAAFGGLDVEGKKFVILVELSGSMKGRNIEAAAKGVLCGALALEEAGARVEIVGYTTTGKTRPLASWNGDSIVRYPGRLSELRCVVVKPTDMPAAGNEGRVLAMSKCCERGRENLDGEAIAWAAGRAASLGGAGLILVTDGFKPQCETSLRYADDSAFLAKHHKAVVEQLSDDLEIAFEQCAIAEPHSARDQDVYRSPSLCRAEIASVAQALSSCVANALDHTRRIEAEADETNTRKAAR